MLSQFFYYALDKIYNKINFFKVIKSTDQIYVVMTLFDKPKKYGPVSPPPEDDLESLNCFFLDEF